MRYNEVQRKKQSWDINAHKDAKILHCSTCTLCIGETRRRQGDRFREHLRDAEEHAKDASKPVARHLNLPNNMYSTM